MRSLTPDEIKRFLDLPIVATLATYRRNGAILLSPVWFEWNGSDFLFIIDRVDIKGTHLARNPHAAVTVYSQRPPYEGVEASGLCEFENGYGELQKRMATRYLAEVAPYFGRVPTFLEGNGRVIRLHPERFRAWSFDDWNWTSL